MKRVIWQTPELIVDRPYKRLIRENIIKPAEKHIKEHMIREEVKKFCNLKIQTPPSFRDMGDNPLRFRKRTFQSVLPFKTRITKKDISTSVNAEYESGDLIQISQRLIRGRKGPVFAVSEVISQGKYKDGIRVVLEIIMTRFCEADYKYEVVRVSDIK